VHLKDWLEEGRKQLDEAREALRYLCEPVALPREMEQYLHYFCGDAADAEALNEHRAAAHFVLQGGGRSSCAPMPIAQDLTEAGYSDAEVAALQKEVEFYAEIRAAIKKHSGEELDIKPYEADMRHLINTYIQADPARTGQPGRAVADRADHRDRHPRRHRPKLNEKGKLSKNAIAEGIINNVRKTIIRDQLTDPRFYEQMSKLLDDLIKQSRADTAAYEEFLRRPRPGEAAGRPAAGRGRIPAVLHGKPEAVVLFNNLASLPATSFRYPSAAEDQAALALKIDRAMRERAPAGWYGDQAREAQVLNALFPLLDRDREATQAIFEIIKNQPGYQMSETIQLGDVVIAVTRKAVKHVHLSVHPPAGHVTLVAPTGTRLEVARAYAVSKVGLDSQPAGETAGAGARDTAPVRRAGEPLPLGAALSALRRRAGREARREAGSSPDYAERPPWQLADEAGRSPVRMAPYSAACGRTRAHQAVGGKAGRNGQRLLPPAHEDEVGRLQPPDREPSPEYRVGQETQGLA
jgi:hypothetical protein